MNTQNYLTQNHSSQIRLLPVHYGYPSPNHESQKTTGINLRRLIKEDPNVEGTCWFSKHSEDPFHILANIVRIIVLLIVSPIYLIFLDVILLRSEQAKRMKKSWFYERCLPSSAVLRHPPGAQDKLPEYEPSDFLPRWLLKVIIENNTLKSMDQISYGDALKIESFHKQGYTALSYSMESAEWLFYLAGGQLKDCVPAGESRKYSLRDRRRMAKKYLEEYCRVEVGDMRHRPPNRTEFIWLDEFCLSDDSAVEQEIDEEQKKQLEGAQRREELGRLADIFRGARSVCVFCHDVGCTHTTQRCCWGKRLFTLAEILHANRVDVMTTKTKTASDVTFSILSMSGHNFRRQMLQSASLSGKWHLWAIMQATVNSGSVPWQVAIHSLVVEAIIRDDVTGYTQHKLLGKGLNGLLPRRAKLEDLKGQNGWVDLAWLLELNQGFYNAVSLAAVCRLGSDGAWIGPPIEPAAGNERLEPLATGFPVGAVGSGDIIPALNILGAEGIKVRHSFKRDALALHHQKDWRRLAMFARFAAYIFMSLGFLIAISSGFINLLVKLILIPWSFAAAFVTFQLVVGTMYLEEGWVFLEDVGHEQAASMLTKQDVRLARQGIPSQWGPDQLIPQWDCSLKDSRRGMLIDVRTGIMADVTVAGKPNALVVLAIHGNGVTCMLINRPTDDSFKVAKKVGMCSLPPYMLHMTAKGGSVTIGGGKVEGERP